MLLPVQGTHVFKSPYLLMVLVVSAAAGCAGHRAHLTNWAPCADLVGKDVIFAVDGAGNFQECSKALRRAVKDGNLPCYVETVEWSHAFPWRPRTIWTDHTDMTNAEEQGKLLAERVLTYRKCCPDRTIVIAGHCSGSNIVLHAVDYLPIGSVDHIILLAPSVSEDHDLRNALRASRHGVDVYYSGRDWFHLGALTSLFGNADRHWRPAAGRVGFKPVGDTDDDVALYANLRQHPWKPNFLWTGNEGGHFGAYSSSFLLSYVLNFEDDAAHPAWRPHGDSELAEPGPVPDKKTSN